MKNSWQKNVAIFLACQGISLFGSALVQYAMIWHITLTTRSGVYATMAIICGALPMLLLAPFTGVWADRYNRKILIILSDSFIALITLILAILYMSGHQYIWLLYVVMALRALGTAVQTPCVGAMLPDLVPVEHLTRVNGLNSTMNSLIFLGSPMLAGALMGLTPLSSIFFIDVATAALAVVLLLLFLRLPARPAREILPGAYLFELKQGFAYIGGQRYLRNFFIFSAAMYVLITPFALLTPLQVTRTFNGTEWHLAALEVAFSGGMLLGGLAVTAWGGLKNRIHTLGYSFGLMGLMGLMLGLPHRFPIYLLILTLSGLMLPFLTTASAVLLQERVDPAYLGRVFGVLTMLSSGMMPLGMLVFGPLADIVAIEWLLIFSGIGSMVAAVLLLRNKALIIAGETVNSE